MQNEELFRLGQHRGRYVLTKGTGPDRKRKSLGEVTEQEANRLLAQENQAIITRGKSDLNACLALYREQKRGDKWNKNDQRNENRIKQWFGHMSIDDIDEDTCEQFADDRRDDGLSENSIRIELAHLRAALRYAKRRKIIKHAPDLYVPTSDEAREYALTREDAYKLIENATAGHVRLYIVTALVTGGRPSHILQLKYPRIDLERRIIDFRLPGEKRTNKRRPRVTITETLAEMIAVAKTVARTDYLIEWNGNPVRDIKKGIASAARRAGVFSRTPTGETKIVTPYDLRHTAGTLMAMDGVPLVEIAERLGHDKIDTTRRHYLHLMPEHMSRSRDALDFRPRIRNDS